jgi:hypothetical protein
VTSLEILELIKFAVRFGIQAALEIAPLFEKTVTNAEVIAALKAAEGKSVAEYRQQAKDAIAAGTV